MNATSIDKLRYTQQPKYADDIVQTGDDFFVDGDITVERDDKPVQQEEKEDVKRQEREAIRYKKTKKYLMEKMPEFLREPVIIVVVYMILSTDVVKKTLATYIPQLKSETGAVPFLGVVIYGIILATCYYILKTMLL